MNPPAKRPRRNPVEHSDEEDEQLRATNTLANYLVSSPNPPRKLRRATASPRKTHKSSVRVNCTSENPTKVPADNKAKKRSETVDLKTLFSKQAQKPSSKGHEETDARNIPIDDIISDPISGDEISRVKVSSSSLVGQHAQKRLKRGVDSTLTQLSDANQRFIRPSKSPGFLRPLEEMRTWAERFGPRNLSELAVHRRKVTDVRRWLEDVTAGRSLQRVLVLKGAAGSGKTTTVRLLAQDMGCELLEWKNPMVASGTVLESVSAKFNEFLGRGSKFAALDVESPAMASTSSSSENAVQDQTKRIILIEEFPNTFSRVSPALASFRKSIVRYLAAQCQSSLSRKPRKEAVHPIVLVITETLLSTSSASADSLTVHRLLGPEITRHPGVGMIEFHAIAPSLLARALDLIVQKEARVSGRRKTPGPLVLKRLGEIGDIRNAVSSLQFLCLKGDHDADWGGKVAFTKQKKAIRDGIGLTEGETESLEAISQREASLGIFHAVGKVVYNKREEKPSSDVAVERLPAHLTQLARPNRSQVCVNRLIDESGTDTQTFISALHENYVLSCESTGPMDLSTPMDYVNDCIEHLSLSDLLCPSRDVFFGGGRLGFSGRDSGSYQLRQDEMSFQVAVRGMLFSLPHPVRRKATMASKGGDAFKMFYPASLKLWSAKEEMESLIEIWSSRLLRGDLEMTERKVMEGAKAFRRPQAATEGSSWMERQQHVVVRRTGRAKGLDGERPLLSLGSTARQEMLLDRLPYMACVARAYKSAIRLEELEKVVSFSGPAVAGDDESEAEVDGPSGEAWATDKASEWASPRKPRVGITAAEAAAELFPAQKLTLSDDDIED